MSDRIERFDNYIDEMNKPILKYSDDMLLALSSDVTKIDSGIVSGVFDEFINNNNVKAIGIHFNQYKDFSDFMFRISTKNPFNYSINRVSVNTNDESYDEYIVDIEFIMEKEDWEYNIDCLRKNGVQENFLKLNKSGSSYIDIGEVSPTCHIKFELNFKNLIRYGIKTEIMGEPEPINVNSINLEYSNPELSNSKEYLKSKLDELKQETNFEKHKELIEKFKVETGVSIEDAENIVNGNSNGIICFYMFTTDAIFKEEDIKNAICDEQDDINISFPELNSIESLKPEGYDTCEDIHSNPKYEMFAQMINEQKRIKMCFEVIIHNSFSKKFFDQYINYLISKDKSTKNVNIIYKDFIDWCVESRSCPSIENFINSSYEEQLSRESFHKEIRGICDKFSSKIQESKDDISKYESIMKSICDNMSKFQIEALETAEKMGISKEYILSVYTQEPAEKNTSIASYFTELTNSETYKENKNNMCELAKFIAYKLDLISETMYKEKSGEDLENETNFQYINTRIIPIYEWLKNMKKIKNTAENAVNALLGDDEQRHDDCQCGCCH